MELFPWRLELLPFHHYRALYRSLSIQRQGRKEEEGMRSDASVRPSSSPSLHPRRDRGEGQGGHSLEQRARESNFQWKAAVLHFSVFTTFPEDQAKQHFVLQTNSQQKVSHPKVEEEAYCF